MTFHSKTRIAACVAMWAAMSTAPAMAQDEGLTFTAPQAIGGGGHYQRACASCHGAELEGGAAPGLGGDSFSFKDRPVADLHVYIKDLMPADAPGSLSDAQVSTIIAFMAQKDGMTAGSKPIPTDPAKLGDMQYGQPE